MRRGGWPAAPPPGRRSPPGGTPCADQAALLGNRLWEWVSVGHYGLGGFDVKQNAFLGHEWPPEEELRLHGFRNKALRFQRRTHAVALLLLRALAIALGRDEDFFEEPFELDAPDNPSFIAWNKYPAVKPEDAAKPQPPRLHAHADMDVLTILFQRVGALCVRRRTAERRNHR